ncbi:MAG TPA: hypothetical protein VFI05_11960, partial [Nitrospiraceae bacterium]|nr:hypothetical protein [Nitrospiraceae bacterium]
MIHQKVRREDEMAITKEAKVNRLAAVLMLIGIGLAACTTVDPVPQALLAKNDHQAVAAWYEKEAANLRQKAHEMEVMEETYRQDPERSRQLMVHAPKADFIAACKTLATMYTDSARQAES